MALYPLPKQYSTDFSNPKKKPVGDVEIDWSNPLTKGLKAFYMPVMGGLTALILRHTCIT